MRYWNSIVGSLGGAIIAWWATGDDHMTALGAGLGCGLMFYVNGDGES